MAQIMKSQFFSAFAPCGLFPFAMLLATASAWFYMQAGINPGAIIGLVSLANIVILVCAERLFPYRKDWQSNHQDIITDLLHNLLNSYAFREVCKISLIAMLLPLTAAIAAHGSWWPHQWPLWLQVALTLAAAELGYYWIHRFSHEKPDLWPFHAIHHSAPRLYWLNAGREHPIGVALFYIAGALPLIILGAPAEALLFFYVIEAVHGQFQHCNVRLILGPLNRIFSSADLHRWHHSDCISEANNNYGLTLSIWDSVFGTRYLPTGREVTHIGLSGMPNFPQSFGQQMLAPLSWRKLQNRERQVVDTLHP